MDVLTVVSWVLATLTFVPFLCYCMYQDGKKGEQRREIQARHKAAQDERTRIIIAQEQATREAAL